MTRIGIIGHKGRMGAALLEAISEAGADHAGGVDVGGDVAALAGKSDILVDFSAPAALEATLDACVAASKPIVIGTTGLEERHHFLIDDVAKDIAILQTGNTSLGVNMLAYLVHEAAARLGDDWDIEIAEMHHRHKVDAPSGTALLLGEAAANARGIDLAANSERGRDGNSRARKDRRDRLRQLARRQRHRRSQRHPRERRRKHNPLPPRRGAGHIRKRRGEGGALARGAG